jgi:hypothetical protein
VRALDGPAAGVTLNVARAPLFLRLVCTGTSWDALDQPWDIPKAGEIVHVYRRAGAVTHVCTRGAGCYESADYEHVPDVDGEQLRATAAWRAWARAQAIPA